MSEIIILIAFMCVLILVQMLFFISRYKRVDKNQVLVLTGKVSTNPNEKFKIVTHGAVFVWPVLQNFYYLDTGIKLFNGELKTIDSNNILLKANIHFNCSLINSQAEIAKFIKSGVDSIDSENNFILNTALDVVKKYLKTLDWNNSRPTKMEIENIIFTRLEEKLIEYGVKLHTLNEIVIE